jgi:hypothetical protein
VPLVAQNSDGGIKPGGRVQHYTGAGDSGEAAARDRQPTTPPSYLRLLLRARRSHDGVCVGGGTGVRNWRHALWLW